MIDNTFVRVALWTAVIGIHLLDVIHVSGEELPSPSEDEIVSPDGEYFDAVALSKKFFQEIQEQSELFGSLVELVTYNPAENDIDPDLNHCVSVKKAAGIEILTNTIDSFLKQCISPLRKLGVAVGNRIKEFLEAIKSLNHLAYEDATACMKVGDTINYEPILECLDNVLNYRELSFYDYLEEMRQNYLTINRRLKNLNECGRVVVTIIEDQIQSVISDISKCATRIEQIETFFAETYDEAEEWSGDRGKTVVSEIVTFAIGLIMDRIDELNMQLGRKYYHTEINNLAVDRSLIIDSHKEALDSIAKLAIAKVEDTERLGARFNQCTSTIAEETKIRVKLAVAALDECVAEAVEIQKYFTSGITNFSEEIHKTFDKQKELILTCTGKLIVDMNSPTDDEVKQTVSCLKFKLLFSSEKSLVDLEGRVQTFLTSTWEKLAHFQNSLETVKICTGAAVFNFKEIMEDNVDFIDLCVEEESSEYLEKDEL